MQSISMDLISEFYPNSSEGNCYALAVICMFIGDTFCIPLKFKSAKEVVQAYIENVYATLDQIIFFLIMVQNSKWSVYQYCYTIGSGI